MTVSSPPKPQLVRLLDADPDLGQGLSPAEREIARRFAICETATVGRGIHDPWTVGSEDLLGLLVLDGLLIRSVEVAGRRCGELVGPGAIMRPWDHFGNYAPLPFEVRWRVVSPVRMAMLDQRLSTVAARWPSLMHAIIRRAVGRSQTLALNVAIHALQHVENRLLVLLWHLADRFGRVTPAGTLVPLELSHQDLAELVGAQRPSVSARISAMQRRGELVRQADRTWLLPGAPPAELRDTRARATAVRQISRGVGTQPRQLDRRTRVERVGQPSGFPPESSAGQADAVDSMPAQSQQPALAEG